MTLLHPDTFSIHSTGVSSVQLLPNNNFLICSGRWGRVFEINPITNQVVWEYTVPLRGGSSVEQGTELELNNNITFRFTRYPLDFAAFVDRDLSPGGFLELNPDENFCANATITSITTEQLQGVKTFPNPATSYLTIEKGNIEEEDWYLYDLTGKLVQSFQIQESVINVELIDGLQGLYFLGTKDAIVQKVVIAPN